MLAIIPARIGSEGVKDKNWRDFCGKSLVEHAAAFAREMSCPRITVTTNCGGVMLPPDVEYLHSEIHDPEALAKDVWRDALVRLGVKSGLTCYLEPTSPFRNRDDFRRCEAALENDPWYQMAATVSPAAPPQKLLQMGVQDGHRVPLGDLTNRPRQGMGRHYRRNGAVYMACVEHILSGHMMEARCCPIVSRGIRINIDTEDDWLMAELLWRHQHASPGI